MRAPRPHCAVSVRRRLPPCHGGAKYFGTERKEVGVARKPNYKFDRQQRERAKAEKKAAKEEKKAEMREAADPENPEDPAAAEV
jgi:sRNA-binding protein